MSSIITNAGLALIAKLQAEHKVLNIDKFIYAYIPDLNAETEVDPAETMPEPDQIVHESTVTKEGYADPNTVVFSNLLGTDVGDFEFNWIGLYSTENDTLCVIYHQYPQNKWKTKATIIGNMLAKNIGIQYLNITDLTNITIKAETWQMDLTNRLDGMDNREQASNYDLYGEKYFTIEQEDAFLVYENEGTYYAKPGIGYVMGIRVESDIDSTVGLIDALPSNVYIDTWLDGDYTGVEAKYSFIVSAEEQSDYIDASGQQHYVQVIAAIAADGTITDLRAGTKGKINKLDNKKVNYSDNPDLDDSGTGASTKATKVLADRIKKIPEQKLSDNPDLDNSKTGASTKATKVLADRIKNIKSLQIGDIIPSSRTTRNCKPTEMPCCMGLMELKIEKYPEASKNYDVIDGKFTAGMSLGDFLRNTGGNAAALNEHQDDAIREIIGSIWFHGAGTCTVLRGANEVFTPTETLTQFWNMASSSQGTSLSGAEFKASNVVPTANENRPFNTTKNFFEIVARRYNTEAYEAHKDKEMLTVYGFDTQNGDREYRGYSTHSPINYIESTPDKIVYWHEKVAEKNFFEDAPPEAIEGFAICRTKDLKSWEHVEDNRGKTVYEKATGLPVEVTYLGKLKAEHTTVQPPANVYYYQFDESSETWILDENKKAELTKSLKSKIRYQTEKNIQDLLWNDEKTEETAFESEFEHLRFTDIEDAKAYCSTLGDKPMDQLLPLLNPEKLRTSMKSTNK